MVNPDANEAARVAEVAATEASNVWRGVKDPAVFAQDNKDYPEHLSEQNLKTTTTSGDLESTRQAAVAEQARVDAWRGASLAQHLDQKDYPVWVNEYNTKTLDNAAKIEAIRTLAVNT